MGLLSKCPFRMADRLETGSLTKLSRIGELHLDKRPGDCSDEESELVVTEEVDEEISSESSSLPSEDRQAFKAF